MSIYKKELTKLKKQWPHHCTIKDPPEDMWIWLHEDMPNADFFCDYFADFKLFNTVWIGFKNPEDYMQFYLLWG